MWDETGCQRDSHVCSHLLLCGQLDGMNLCDGSHTPPPPLMVITTTTRTHTSQPANHIHWMDSCLHETSLADPVDTAQALLPRTLCGHACGSPSAARCLRRHAPPSTSPSSLGCESGASAPQRLCMHRFALQHAPHYGESRGGMPSPNPLTLIPLGAPLTHPHTARAGRGRACLHSNCLQGRSACRGICITPTCASGDAHASPLSNLTQQVRRQGSYSRCG